VTGAVESRAQQSGWRPGGGGQADGGRGVAGWCAVRMGGGRGILVSVRRVAGA
jgi:hypothetical protein